MNKLVILLTVVLILSGCAGNYLDKIPNGGFTRFEYHRGGNVTSAHIIATDAVAENGIVLVDKIDIHADYGPFLNFEVKLEGYESVAK
jgi:hypothetical protein